jgi:hypothetical protein
MRTVRIEWREWLYDDELERVAAIDQEVERLQSIKNPLLFERRQICQKAYQRARRDALRENS